MSKFILSRLLSLALVLILTSFFSYSLVFLSPGKSANLILQALYDGEPTVEQIDKFNEKHGLDEPLLIQYSKWLKKAVRGDFGKSFSTGKYVMDEYKDKFKITIKLFLTGEIIAIFIAIPIGIISAIKNNKLFDKISRIISLTGISIPNFWLGILFIYIFSIKLNWLPSFGSTKIINMILPAMTLGISGAMSLIRITRTSVLEVIRLNYIRTARSKGLEEGEVFLKHALKNAIIPIITAIGMHISHMAGGSVIIEQMFGWPGLGRYFVSASVLRDIPAIQCFVFMSAIIFVIINLIIDILYILLDPRIKYHSKGA